MDDISIPSMAAFIQSMNGLQPAISADWMCTICQHNSASSHRNGKAVRACPNNHLFHQKCIIGWLRSGQPQRNRCPLCSQAMCRLNELTSTESAERGVDDWRPEVTMLENEVAQESESAQFEADVDTDAEAAVSLILPRDHPPWQLAARVSAFTDTSANGSEHGPWYPSPLSNGSLTPQFSSVNHSATPGLYMNLSKDNSSASDRPDRAWSTEAVLGLNMRESPRFIRSPPAHTSEGIQYRTSTTQPYTAEEAESQATVPQPLVGEMTQDQAAPRMRAGNNNRNPGTNTQPQPGGVMQSRDNVTQAHPGHRSHTRSPLGGMVTHTGQTARDNNQRPINKWEHRGFRPARGRRTRRELSAAVRARRALREFEETEEPPQRSRQPPASRQMPAGHQPYPVNAREFARRRQRASFATSAHQPTPSSSATHPSTPLSSSAREHTSFRPGYAPTDAYSNSNSVVAGTYFSNTNNNVRGVLANGEGPVSYRAEGSFSELERTLPDYTAQLSLRDSEPRRVRPGSTREARGSTRTKIAERGEE